MRQQEIEAVIKLTPFDRYKYFIKKVADYEEIWTVVHQDGTYALSEIEDETFVSFWPASEYVSSNLNDEWRKCVCKKLNLNELEKELFNLIEDKGYLINVFGLNGKTGFIVNLDEFVRDLNEELENYL